MRELQEIDINQKNLKYKSNELSVNQNLIYLHCQIILSNCNNDINYLKDEIHRLTNGYEKIMYICAIELYKMWHDSSNIENLSKEFILNKLCNIINHFSGNINYIINYYNNHMTN